MIIMQLMELKEYAEAIALLATFLFAIQMLTPVATFYRVVRTGTVGDLSCVPYSTAFLSCSVWMLYGMLIQDSYVTNTNLYAAALQLSFILCYYLYCINKGNVAKQLFASGLIFACACLYIKMESDVTLVRQHMALFCSLVTLAFFAAPFSNLRHVLRERNADSLPFLLIVFTFLVSLLWMLYGFAIRDLALQVTNLLGVILSSMQLFLIAWFRDPKRHYKHGILTGKPLTPI